MASEKSPPRIEFPCDYPIKVLGQAHSAFQADIMAIIERHADMPQPDRIMVRESRGGRYMSITVVIRATGTDQLQRIFEELKTDAGVTLVL